MKKQLTVIMGVVGLRILVMAAAGGPIWAADTPPAVRAEAFFAITPEEFEGLSDQYFSARLVSQRFVFAHLDAGPVIFQESVDLEESTLREQGDGRVTVTAYAAAPAADATPLWQFEATGRSGDFLFGDYDYQVYRLKQAFCCDMSAREVYYDLRSGAPLFSTTTPALTLIDAQHHRYIGYDDGFGAEPPSEMAGDRAISGILAYAGREIATQTLAIFANPDEEYREQDFAIRANGVPLPITNNILQFPWDQEHSLADELVLTVRLRCRCDTDETLEIPIVNDAFVIERAVVSPGLTLKAF